MLDNFSNIFHKFKGAFSNRESTILPELLE